MIKTTIWNIKIMPSTIFIFYILYFIFDLILVPRVRIELTTQGFSFIYLGCPKDRTISSPVPLKQDRGLGTICQIIVGAHQLVSTPSLIPMPIKAWFGITLIIRFARNHKVILGLPRFHPVFNPELLRSGPKISPSLYH